jgi:hypothetical protein
VRYLIVAFADQAAAQKIKTLLINSGLPVRGICGTGTQVLQMATQCEGGGVVICPIRFPDMGSQEVMSLLSEDFDMLVLVTSRQQALIGGSGIFTLAEPHNRTAIVDSARQLLETRQLRAAFYLDDQPSSHPTAAPSARPHDDAGEISHSRSHEDQKIIEQAKYLLMNRRKISEADAHRYLQKKSMESGIRLVELARRILTPV